jgi:hypothetical protein
VGLINERSITNTTTLDNGGVYRRSIDLTGGRLVATLPIAPNVGSSSPSEPPFIPPLGHQRVEEGWALVLARSRQLFQYRAITAE